MKRYSFFFFTSIIVPLSMHASSNENYGVTKAREFAVMAFPNLHNEQLLKENFLKMDMTQFHFDPDLKQLTMGFGSSVFKGAEGLDGKLYMTDYHMADGDGLKAQIAALLAGRVSSFDKNGRPLGNVVFGRVEKPKRKQEIKQEIKHNTTKVVFPIQVRLPAPKDSPTSSVKTD